MRKLLVAVILFLLFCVACSGADDTIIVQGFTQEEADGAHAITIEGPLVAEVGDVLTFQISGLPTIDRSKPLTEQDAWLFGPDRVLVFWATPDAPAQPTLIEVAYKIDTQAGVMVSIVRTDQTVTQPGNYRLIVDWNYGQNQLVDHVVTVKGEDPTPPTPPEPPTPNNEPQEVMFFIEGNDLPGYTLEQKEILNSATFREALQDAGHVFKGRYDYDDVAVKTQICQGGQCYIKTTPKAGYTEWWQAARGQALPLMLTRPVSGGSVQTYPLPESVDAAWEVLQ